jgi:kynureninase
MELKSPIVEFCKKEAIDVLDEKLPNLLDEKDSLKEFRAKFHIPKTGAFNPKHPHADRDAVYLCGNSLGLQPKSTKKYVEQELEVWQKVGVEGHFEHEFKRPWLTTDEPLLDGLAHIVGAKKSEVCAMNSLTVNLHLMMVSNSLVLNSRPLFINLQKPGSKF